MIDILQGLRVVEVADWGFVPSATTVLADWGADVIKIEHPVRGDPMRGLVTAGIVPGARGINFFIEQLSRNKRSVGLDLGKSEGLEILYKLIERSDVFVTNFLPPARQRLKLTYDELRAINPRLIYARGHGQGQKGPDANRGSYDAASFWSRSGIADRLTAPGQPLLMQRPAFGDLTAGMFLAGGIAAALFHRERTGKGMEVDVSLLATAVWVGSPDIVAALAYGFDLPKCGVQQSPNPLVNTYWSKDGKGIVLMMLQSERFWPLFAKSVGREDILADARFDTAEKRRERAADLTELLKEIFKQRTRAEWAELFRDTEVIWAPVQSPSEVPSDPQVLANRYLMEFDHPNYGPFKVAASPVQFNNEGPDVRIPAPELGAHTEEVLLELGYDWEQIARWKDAQVIP